MSAKIQKDANRFYKKYVQDFIYYDIKAGICGKANYMVALALIAYTEFMGGMLLGKFQRGWSEKKFNAFIGEYFSKCYTATDAKLKKARKSGLYDLVRNGLAHNYFIKLGDANFTIYMWKPLSCGIEYDQTSDHLHFSIVDYFRDFQNACNRYYQDLKSNKHIEEFQDAKKVLKF